MVPNRVTDEGQFLGLQLARLCDIEMEGKTDNRCRTCAFRSGEHIANGSPETLMTALKCVLEGKPFWCHEHDRPCSGWSVLRSPKGKEIKVPWDYVDGGDYKAGDVIPLPDESMR